MLRTTLGRPWWIASSLLALAAVTVGACSAHPHEDDARGTHSGGAGAGAGSGSGNPSGNGGEAVTVGSANGGSGSNVGGGCVGTGNTAQKVPLDLFVMLDQSGSMDEPAGNGQSKWDVVTGALQAFVTQPETAGIGMGLQYFALTGAASQCTVAQCTMDSDCGGAACGPCMLIIPDPPIGFCVGYNPGGDSCDPADYATAEVPIQPLPGVGNAIVASLQAHAPATGTPTQPALKGAVTFASDWANQNPSHVTAVVLATDGVPQACNSTPDNTAAEAAAGFASSPSIRTFVIGVGSALGDLNKVAAAGGTGQAFLIDANANAQQAFLDALNEIQGAALPCAYVIPEAPEGQDLDYGQVNVEYTPGGGGQPTIVSKVDGESSCGPAGGWYYDDPADPAQILLCPATCELVASDTEGKVEVVLGCATKIE
ncbi:MAG: hypothetical protein WKG00_39115 [Polyangiaceae bacterium]